MGEEAILRADAPPGGVFEEATAFDSDGGYAAWVDTRNDVSDNDIFVQKVGLDGTPAWTANGLLICDVPRAQSEPAITGDGTGGAVVVWRDRAEAQGINAQRVSSNGSMQWTANGQRVSGTLGFNKNTPNIHLAPDGTFLLSYGEDRSSPTFDLEYWLVAQKISTSGELLWGQGIGVVEGVRVMRSVPDGSGGLLGLDESAGANRPVSGFNGCSRIRRLHGRIRSRFPRRCQRRHNSTTRRTGKAGLSLLISNPTP